AWFAFPLHEINGGGGGFVIDCFHPRFRYRARSFGGLLTGFARTGVGGRTLRVSGLASEHAARTNRLLHSRVPRIKPVLRILFGIEMVQVAKKLVEAMHGRQIFISVAEVILTELARGVAERLE